MVIKLAIRNVNFFIKIFYLLITHKSYWTTLRILFKMLLFIPFNELDNMKLKSLVNRFLDLQKREITIKNSQLK